MAETYEVGTKVKVNIDDQPYAGTIITYDEETPTTYKVSVDGFGKVLSLTDDNIEGAL